VTNPDGCGFWLASSHRYIFRTLCCDRVHDIKIAKCTGM